MGEIRYTWPNAERDAAPFRRVIEELLAAGADGEICRHINITEKVPRWYRFVPGVFAKYLPPKGRGETILSWGEDRSGVRDQFCTVAIDAIRRGNDVSIHL